MFALRSNSYRALLQDRNFLSFWLGFTFSALGDSLTRVALTWFILEETNSPEALGTLTVAYTAPILLGGFFAGPLLDRFSARRVMLIDNAIRGIIFAAIPVLYALEALEVWHVYIFAALYGLLMMVSLAGGPTLIPSLVGESRLDTANAMETLSYTLSGVIGPPLAGFLIVLVGTMNVVVIDAFSYLVFAFVLARISVMQKEAASESSNVSLSMREAARLMLSDRVILSTTIMFMFANAGLGIMTVYLPLLSDQIAPGNPGVYGALLGAMALGEVISAAIAGSLVSNMGLGVRIALAQILSGAALALLVAPGSGFVGGGLFLLGFFSAPLTIWAQTLRMQVIPPEMRGRVFALLRTLMQGATPLGGALAGIFLPIVGIQMMIGFSALVIGLPGLAGMYTKELRSAGQE